RAIPRAIEVPASGMATPPRPANAEKLPGARLAGHVPSGRRRAAFGARWGGGAPRRLPHPWATATPVQHLLTLRDRSEWRAGLRNRAATSPAAHTSPQDGLPDPFLERGATWPGNRRLRRAAAAWDH